MATARENRWNSRGSSVPSAARNPWVPGPRGPEADGSSGSGRAISGTRRRICDHCHAGKQKWPGEGAHLVQRLVDREPAATAGPRRHPCQQRGFRWTAHCLAGPLDQDERGCNGDACGTEQRCERHQGNRHSGHGVADDGQAPMVLAAVRPRARDQAEDECHCLAGAGHHADGERGGAEAAEERSGDRAHALVDHVRRHADQAEREHGPPRRPARACLRGRGVPVRSRGRVHAVILTRARCWVARSSVTVGSRTVAAVVGLHPVPRYRFIVPT